MNAIRKSKRKQARCRGLALAFVLLLVLVLMLLGFGLIKIAEGDVMQMLLFQNETIAMAGAEAAFEQAIFWMSDNPDLLLEMDVSGTAGTLSLPDSRADYEVTFYGFVGYRPVFEVTADGYCGSHHRGIRVYVMQSVSGWEMGMCRVPDGNRSTAPVYFVDGETVDMPIHVNTYDPPDDSQRDIFISGNPVFRKSVSMEEARRSAGGYDKYAEVMNRFKNGIVFEQPRSLISDEVSVAKKIEWYRSTLAATRADLILEPVKNSKVKQAQPAVQIEFYVGSDGRGYVRITDDCTVRGYTTGSDTWDYKIKPGTDAGQFEKYPIYGYHYIPQDGSKRTVHAVDSIQIAADYGGHKAPPCGMIYVDGNVIVGSAAEYAADSKIARLNTVQGKVAVIATGNIWVANAVTVSDRNDDGDSFPRQLDKMPHIENPNALALFAGGVVKIVDPGLVESLDGNGVPSKVSKMTYEPIGIKDAGQPNGTWRRHLPDPMIIEAAITVGGGGWGAENVKRDKSSGRKASGIQDDLIFRGTLTEVVRGVVGLAGTDGYLKQYYFDERMLSGLIPGTVRLKGKFTTAPSGWSDFRVDPKPEK